MAAGALLVSAPAAFRVRSESLREGRELYNLRRGSGLAGFGSLSPVTVARDGDRPVKLVELVAADPYGLLATPAETFSPRQVPQRHILAAALLLLVRDLDLLLRARGFEGTTRRITAARHHVSVKLLGEYS